MAKITCLHFYCYVGNQGLALGNPGLESGGFGDWGDICVPGGLLGYPRVQALPFGACISYMSITDFTKLFWSGDAYLVNKIALKFSLWTSVFPSPLFRAWSLA